ncbi:hypothetical protein [Prosthecobacter fusiformis]|uniref:hypothetical protein n=1 Tax=Prosthecobacter fusiformis TaxID=48464 RepID=UPI001414F7AA|nr:hypothetical protein [Prosthecobacter fusiformis]
MLSSWGSASAGGGLRGGGPLSRSMAGQQLRRWREEEGRALSVPGVMPPAVLRPEQDGQLRPVVPGVPAAGGMGGAGAAAAPTQPA